MKRMLLLAFLSCVISVTGCGREQQAETESSFRIDRGINIAHFMSQTDARGAQRAAQFTLKDIRYVAGLGFDHVRIPVDEEQLFDENGSRITEAFNLLDWTVGKCIENNLRVVVDMHILRSHYFMNGDNKLFTDKAAQEQYYQFWRELSSLLSKYPVSMLAYELLNEPQGDAKTWNAIYTRCYEEIRKLEPKRVIVLGGSPSQDFSAVRTMDIPQNDPNIILSFHYYNPFLLTHYRAEWLTQKDYRGPVHYPGTVLTEKDYAEADCPEEAKNSIRGYVNLKFDKEAIRQQFMQAASVASAHGLMLYCGEYGCLNTPDEGDRFRWHGDMEDLFDELGIARAVWCYKEGETGFGLLKNGVPDEGMIEAMNLSAARK